MASGTIDDEALHALAQEVPDEKVMALGLALKLPKPEIDKYVDTNTLKGKVTSVGTSNMLSAWKYGKSESGDISKPLQLADALRRVGLIFLLEKYFRPEEIEALDNPRELRE